MSLPLIILVLVGITLKEVFATNCQQYLPTEIKLLSAELADKQFILSSEQQHITDNQYQLSGDASVLSSSFSLKAQQINFNKAKHDINASKKVQLLVENMVFEADSLNATNINEQLKFSTNHVNYYFTDRLFVGSASSIISQNKLHQFNNATFSTCPSSDKVWQIKAQLLELNNEKNSGYARAAKFELLGIPIFYLPHYNWVLSGRASGFLTADFGTYNSENGNSGFEISQPYYFNLAPHKDLTVALDYLSESGFGISGRYRYLLQQQDLDLKWRYFPDDDIKKRKRWQLDLEHKHQFSSELKLTTNINRVSDRGYFTDIEHKSFSDRTLNSDIKLSYNKNDINAFLITEHEQLISDNSGYTRKPGLQISQHKNTKLGQFYALADITNFDTNQLASPTGLRSHLQLSYGKNLYIDNVNIKPELNLYQTHYNLDDIDNQTRDIVNFNIDSSLDFNRLFNKNYLHTLTPRVFYNYSSDKNQTDLPNFDANLKTLNYQSLFSNQIYSGFDRLQAANNIVVGLESNWYQASSSEHFLSINVAQAFYKNETYNPFELDDKSDMVLQTILNVGSNELELRLQYDTDEKDISKSYYFWRYKADEDSLLVWEYAEEEEDRGISVYAKTKLDKNYRMFWALQYDLDQDISNRQTVGVNYQNCCLSVYLSYSSSQSSSASGHNDKISISFDLTGFISGAKNSSIKRYNDDLSDWF